MTSLPDEPRVVLDAPDNIASLCVYRDRLFLAAGTMVFELVNGAWRPMVFIYQPPEPTLEPDAGIARASLT